MHLVCGLALLASIVNLADAASNSTHRLIQLRLWGQPNCHASNLGEEGVYDDQVGLCEPLDNYDIVRSVRVDTADSNCTRECKKT